MRQITGTVQIAKDDDVSGAIFIPEWALLFSLLIPDVDAGDIGIEMSIDDGDNYYPILDPSDGQDVVILASGSDPGHIDISEVMKAMPHRALFRLTSATQSTAAVTISFCIKG